MAATACLSDPRHVAIANNSQQPGFHIGPPESVEPAKGTQHRLLHDVVGICVGAHQPSCEIGRRIQMRHRVRLKPPALFIHGCGWSFFPSSLSIITPNKTQAPFDLFPKDLNIRPQAETCGQNPHALVME